MNDFHLNQIKMSVFWYELNQIKISIFWYE